MQDFDVGYSYRTVAAEKSKAAFWVLGGVLLFGAVIFFIVNGIFAVFLITALFAAANAGLRMYKAYLDFPLELELTTFAAVTITMGFGLKAGIVSAIVIGIAGDVFTGVTMYTPITVSSFILAAIIATIFPATFFSWAGIMISAITCAGSYLLYRITESFTPFENSMYAATNFIWNAYMFFGFAWLARLII